MAALLAFAPSRLLAETTQYAYDDAGRLIGAFYESGKSIRYHYDAAGNLLQRTVAVFIDTDGDHMDDGWEVFYFGDLTRDGSGDFDGDGMSDLAEFLAGTNPLDSDLMLRVQNVSGGEAASLFQIEWSAIPGLVYRVQYNQSLLPHEWYDLPGDVTAESHTGSKLDDTFTGTAKRFYRVVIIK